MIPRLEGTLSALFVRRYRQLLRRRRADRAGARRDERRLRDAIYLLEQQVDELRQQLRDAETIKEVHIEEAVNLRADTERLRGEIEILVARDELWMKWETRERARLDSETARYAAAKARALEVPNTGED